MDSWDEKIRDAALKKIDISDQEKSYEIANIYIKYGVHAKLRATAVGIMGKLKDYRPAIEALMGVVKDGREHNRYRPVSKAISKLAKLNVDGLEPLLVEIESKRGNRYAKKAARAALKKIRISEKGE